jgi:hypothetical protein
VILHANLQPSSVLHELKHHPDMQAHLSPSFVTYMQSCGPSPPRRVHVNRHVLRPITLAGPLLFPVPPAGMLRLLTTTLSVVAQALSMRGCCWHTCCAAAFNGTHSLGTGSCDQMVRMTAAPFHWRSGSGFGHMASGRFIRSRLPRPQQLVDVASSVSVFLFLPVLPVLLRPKHLSIQLRKRTGKLTLVNNVMQLHARPNPTRTTLCCPPHLRTSMTTAPAVAAAPTHAPRRCQGDSAAQISQ